MQPLAFEPATRARHLGRDCFLVENAFATGVEPVDGTIELELAVDPERAFPGVVWRARGENYESFFVRPHQVGNPDSIQYTPVFNEVSSWQLHHGDGFGGSVSFPICEWFRIRVVFAGSRADVYVADMDEPRLWKGSSRPGRYRTRFRKMRSTSRLGERGHVSRPSRRVSSTSRA